MNSSDLIRAEPAVGFNHPFFTESLTETLLLVDKIVWVVTESFYFLRTLCAYPFCGSTERQFLQTTEDGYELASKFFLWLGTSVNCKDSEGNTALHLSAKQGHLSMLHFLTSQPGIHLVEQNHIGITALEGALSEDHRDSAEFLANHQSIDLNSEDAHGSTLLHRAAQRGDIDTVSFLSERDDIQLEKLDQNSYQALELALINNKLDTAKALASHLGVHLNTLNQSGNTLMHKAAKNNSVAILVFLSNQPGIELTPLNHDGLTPLETAIYSRNEEAAQALASLESADLNTLLGQRGQAVVHRAAEGGDENDLSVLQFLNEQQNIDWNLVDQSGLTPIATAIFHENLEVIEFLVSTGKIHLNAQNEQGSTILHREAANGNLEIVKILANAPGIALNCQDRNGRTPLHLAAINRHSRVTQFLRTHQGINLDIQDIDGKTALNIVESQILDNELRLRDSFARFKNRMHEMNDTIRARLQKERHQHKPHYRRRPVNSDDEVEVLYLDPPC